MTDCGKSKIQDFPHLTLLTAFFDLALLKANFYLLDRVSHLCRQQYSTHRSQLLDLSL